MNSRQSKHRPLVRIVVKKRLDGKREVVCHDPKTNRILRSGMVIWPNEVEQALRELRQIFDKAGLQVIVKQME